MWESTDSVGANDLGGSYGGPRWSFHNARPPAWLQNQDPRVIQFFHDNVFDVPSIDPTATLTRMEQSYMAESARLGVRVDATTANVLVAYAKLQLGLIDWRTIANEAGSATPSGPAALDAPILDVIASREAAAIQAVASQTDPNNYNGDDAHILATLTGAGINFGAGIANPLTYQPVALSPMPNPGGREAQALGQGGGVAGSPYAGLSSFEGFGPGGNYADMAPAAPSSSRGISPIILIALVAGAVYLATRN